MQTCTTHWGTRTIVCACVSGLLTAPNLFCSSGTSAAKGIGAFHTPTKMLQACSCCQPLSTASDAVAAALYCNT
jgi:hypothetical protein